MKGNDSEDIVRIEVDKSNGHYFFTGNLKDYDKDNYVIETIKGEKLIFRKEQIVQIEVIGNEKYKSD